MITNVGIERLRTLYALMAGLPDERVDLLYWRIDNTERTSRVANTQLLRDCGTTGCAVGWACSYPTFRRAGLRWGGRQPVFAGEEGWAAVRGFFGISGDDDGIRVQDLFSYDPGALDDDPRLEAGPEFNHRKLVLKRIRRYLLRVGAISEERNFELAAQEGATA